MPITITRKNNRIYTLKEDKNRFFFPREYMRFFDKLKPKQRHTVRCLINTGARINEMRHVMVQDIDFVNKRMVLRVTKVKARKKESRPRIRTIPLSKQFTKYLSNFSKNLKPDSDLSIMSTPGINQAIKKAARLSNIPNPRDFSAHSIRKTLETWLMALGVDGLPLTAHFGHDIRTAAQHYVSPDVFTFEEKKKMRLVIDDLYER